MLGKTAKAEDKGSKERKMERRGKKKTLGEPQERGLSTWLTFILAS